MISPKQYSLWGSVLVDQSRLDRAIEAAKVIEKLVTVVFGQVRVEHNVTDLAVGLQILSDYIDVALQEYLVQPSQHSRDVPVNWLNRAPIGCACDWTCGKFTAPIVEPLPKYSSIFRATSLPIRSCASSVEPPM